jgi:hypothetical protein
MSQGDITVCATGQPQYQEIGWYHKLPTTWSGGSKVDFPLPCHMNCGIPLRHSAKAAGTLPPSPYIWFSMGIVENKCIFYFDTLVITMGLNLKYVMA